MPAGNDKMVGQQEPSGQVSLNLVYCSAIDTSSGVADKMKS